MSAIAEVKEETRRMTAVKKITYQELRPGDEFLVVREKNDFSLKLQEVWQFQVMEILPKIAKVNVIFPQTGHQEVAYFETAAVGECLKVYFNPEKKSYFFDDNIVNIVII